MNDILNRQLLSITGLVQLEKRIRHAATLEEFGFLAVNETHALMRYRQAVLWRRTASSSEGKVVAISGIALPDADAPFLVWLRKVLKAVGESREIEPVDAHGIPPGLAAEWVDWLPPHALWVPLDRSEEERLGGMLLVTSPGRTTTVISSAISATLTHIPGRRSGAAAVTVRAGCSSAGESLASLCWRCWRVLPGCRSASPSWHPRRSFPSSPC